MAVTQSKTVSAGKKPQKTAKTEKKPAKAAAPKAATRRKPHNPKPPFVPTEDQRKIVTLACGVGMTQDQIRKLVINKGTGEPISPTTLREHFRDELDSGAAKVMAQVAGNLVSIASSKTHKGAVTAAIFYLKTQAKWREPEPFASEQKRLEAQASAAIGDKEIEVTLVLEERPPNIKPQEVTDEDMKL